MLYLWEFLRYCTILFVRKSLCLKITAEASKITASVRCDLIFICIELSEIISSFVKIRLVLEIKNVAAILVIIYWNLTIFWYLSDSPQVKRTLIPSITNLVSELRHELSNDVRLRILGKQEITKTSKIWEKTQPSAQSHLQKLKLGQWQLKMTQK